MSNMKEQVKGWGIWLETVEITDVRIASGTLFSNLQSEFREIKKKDAKIYTADINDKILAKRVEYELLMKNIDDKHSLELTKFNNESN